MNKRIFSTLLAAALIASTPLTSLAASAQDDAYKTIQTDVRNKKLPDALEKAKQVLEDKTLTPQDKARFLSLAADLSLKQTPVQGAQATEYYNAILADEAIANSAKISALNNLANAYIESLAGQYLDQMDLSPANELVERALKLPGLTAAEEATAQSNIAALYARQDRHTDAITAYKKAVELTGNEAAKKVLWQKIVDVQVPQGDAEGAIAIAKANGLDLIKLYDHLGRDADAVAEVTKILDDNTISDKERWAAFLKLPCFGYVSTNYPVTIRNNRAAQLSFSKKYLPAFMEVDPNRSLTFLSTYKLLNVFGSGYSTLSAANLEYLAWYGPHLLKAPTLSDKDYALVKVKYVNALAATDAKQALAEATSAQTDARLDAATQFWAKLASAALSNKAGELPKLIKSEKTVPEKDKAQAVLDAAQTALQANNESGARALYGAYEGLFAALPNAQIKSTFASEAPFDVGSWLASPLLKDQKNAAPLDRPYGDNLKLLLETDSTSTGRNVDAATAKDTGDTQTEFYTAFDTRGLSLFFNAHDTQQRAVLDGLVRGGSFEMYLAPGKDQPYFTYLPRWPANDAGDGVFKTMYPNAGFREPSGKDNPLRISVLPTKDGFGVSLYFPWDLFYDKLPTNGTRWQFESIRWTRSGGLSFAGSQSVHNRSSWGDIVFEGMTPEVMNAIKRAIIFGAVAKYREAKKITKPVGQWSDAELGDPIFYAAKVAPLLAQLDEYTAKVSKDMTAADVDTLFREAVPGWMEIEFKVAALRRVYLQKKMLTP